LWLLTTQQAGGGGEKKTMSTPFTLEFPLSTAPAWKDIEPVPQDDGPEPLVPISYSPHFVEVMDYFRAILRKKEYSERALALTEEVIQVNPANYTGWLFRRECLMMLKSDLKKELAFISKVAKQSSKNYQLWHHRRVIVNEIGECGEELDATAKALLEDPKNYHVWAHRQWVLQKFNLFKGELKYVESLLRVDIRNNSAWNQRFFVVKNTSGFNKEIQNREVEFTFKSLEKAPNNLSPWNYLRGLMAQNGFNVDAVKRLAAAILKKDPKFQVQYRFVNTILSYIFLGVRNVSAS